MGQLVEEALARKIRYLENGVERSAPVLAIVLLQLWKKASAGNTRAQRLLVKFEAYAKSIPEIYVITEEGRQAAADSYNKRLEGQRAGRR